MSRTMRDEAQQDLEQARYDLREAIDRQVETLARSRAAYLSVGQAMSTLRLAQCQDDGLDPELVKREQAKLREWINSGRVHWSQVADEVAA